jgi:hypothetical protein
MPWLRLVGGLWSDGDRSREFGTCADPVAVQAHWDWFGPEQIDAVLRKWLVILPRPFTAQDRAEGYCYYTAVWQPEVLPDPSAGPAGRVFFEQTIRDNLDAGRADHVALSSAGGSSAPGVHSTPGGPRLL